MLIGHLGIFGAVLASVCSRLLSVFYIPIKINTILSFKHLEYISELKSDALTRSLPMTLIASILLGYFYWYDISLNILQAGVTAVFFVIINILSFEGTFLISLKGIPLKERFSILKSHYYRFESYEIEKI